MATRDTPWPDGTPCWVDLGAPDIAKAREFYSDVFGDLHAGVPVGTPASWRMYFGAVDTDATVIRVQANGGSVIREPIDHPYGRMSTVADDQGAVFSLLGVPPG
jgi:predicted enzyme related to lactoylglutathione lyase